MKNYQLLFMALLLAILTVTDVFAGRRRNINDLFASERTTIKNHILDYLRSEQNTSASDPADQYLIIKRHKDNDQYIHNYNEVFLTWHRKFIEDLEAYVIPRLSSSLRSKVYGLLPYWDPTDDIPSQFIGSNAVVSSDFTAVTIDNPYDGGTYSISRFQTSNFCNTYTSGSGICNPPSGYNNPIDRFAADLECTHDAVHNAIGGVMGDSQRSPAAAIFWIWHAWVDEVYWDYEQCKGVYASVPYSTNFSSSKGAAWTYTSTTNNGRVRTTTANSPQSGSWHLTMDVVNSSSIYTTNEAILNLDLSSASDVTLSFWWKEWADENHDEDGVFLSSGGPYVKVMDLTGGSTSWQRRVLNISEIIDNNNDLTPSSTFKIKFSQRDNFPISIDGFAFDGISVATGTSCDSFESNFDGWSNSNNDDISWTRKSGTTLSSNTGPSWASNGTRYLYVESSYGGHPSKVAIITKGVSSNVTSITFDYHMYGASMGSLLVQAINNSDQTLITTLLNVSGDQGDIWRRVTNSIPWVVRQGGYTLQFKATTGDSYTSDIAIDNICIGAASGSAKPKLDELVVEEATLDMRGYPNPFSEFTTIEYRLPEASEVVLTVRDITGREVKRLVNGTTQQAGVHRVELNAENMPNGVYLYTLEAKGIKKTGKLILQR